MNIATYYKNCYIYLSEKGCIFFFRSNLQPFEIQAYKNLSAKKMKKTYRNICIYQKDDIPLSSSSGKKPDGIDIYKNF